MLYIYSWFQWVSRPWRVFCSSTHVLVSKVNRKDIIFNVFTISNVFFHSWSGVSICLCRHWSISNNVNYEMYILPKIHGRAVVDCDVPRVLEEHHDDGDIVCGTLPLGLQHQPLRHRLQVICFDKTNNTLLMCFNNVNNESIFILLRSVVDFDFLVKCTYSKNYSLHCTCWNIAYVVTEKNGFNHQQ